jgi:hypothetical protein
MTETPFPDDADEADEVLDEDLNEKVPDPLPDEREPDPFLDLPPDGQGSGG